MRRRTGRERPVAAVPAPVLALLAAGLAAQLAWHALRPPPGAAAMALPEPPSTPLLRVASLGDPVPVARLLVLWLQAFDDQPGVSLPLAALDYAAVEAWLGRALDLDPRSQYPLLLASRVYAMVPDPARQRRMLEFVYRRFFEDPDRRWRWLAHAAIVAKHRLGDLPLALRYARAITAEATGPGVPFWARDMTVLILEDMGELEAARVLLGGLLESGLVDDPRERRFLENKLRELQPEGDENSTDR